MGLKLTQQWEMRECCAHIFTETCLRHNILNRESKYCTTDLFPGCIHAHVGTENTCIYVYVHSLIWLHNPMLYNDTHSAKINSYRCNFAD